MQGLSAPFTAPFMSITPTPDVYNGISFIGSQQQRRAFRSARTARSASSQRIRTGYSPPVSAMAARHANRHKHEQTAVPPVHYSHHLSLVQRLQISLSAQQTGRHADACSKETASRSRFSSRKRCRPWPVREQWYFHDQRRCALCVIYGEFEQCYNSAPARVNVHYVTFYMSDIVTLPRQRSHQYTMAARASAEFQRHRTIAVLGRLRAACRQRARRRTHIGLGHRCRAALRPAEGENRNITRAIHQRRFRLMYYHYALSRPGTASQHPLAQRHRAQSRRFHAGLSVKYTDVKVSIGYRYDTFLNAMDTGIDAAKKSNRHLQRPLRHHQHRASVMGRRESSANPLLASPVSGFRSWSVSAAT